jgi:hypothetical protein
MKTQKEKEFLEKLAGLIDAYNAKLEYTIDDDGIHISVDEKEIFADFLHCSDASDLLLAAAQS